MLNSIHMLMGCLSMLNSIHMLLEVPANVELNTHVNGGAYQC